ncbi:MAG: FMN-binding protein [Erysipelotrichaceae bacterium]
MKKLLLTLFLSIALVGCTSTSNTVTTTPTPTPCPTCPTCPETDDMDEDMTTYYTDGTFEGSATGYGGELIVSVEVINGEIATVIVLENAETADVASDALAEIPKMIVEYDTPNVDVVSGATMTSNAIIEAAQDALNASN